jgi:hypothetical protein
MSEKILVTLTDEQHKLVKSLNGILGNGNSQVIRTIVMSWLSEQGYLSKRLKGGR